MDLLIYIMSRLVIMGGLYKTDPYLALAAVSYYLYEVYAKLNQYLTVKKYVSVLNSLNKNGNSLVKHVQASTDKEDNHEV
jgi:hypothetical protein